MGYDCSMYRPVKIRAFLSVAAAKIWQITKIDVKAAVLQFSFAQRHVFVVSPQQSRYRKELWLLLAVAYRLVNSDVKQQVESDSALYTFGLKQLHELSKLFSM